MAIIILPQAAKIQRETVFVALMAMSTGALNPLARVVEMAVTKASPAWAILWNRF
jgi:hypothetical protein